MREAEGLLPDGSERIRENTGLLLPPSVPAFGSPWRETPAFSEETPDTAVPCLREKLLSRIFWAVVIKQEGGWARTV